MTSMDGPEIALCYNVLKSPIQIILLSRQASGFCSEHRL